jgi:hypothetical protein
LKGTIDYGILYWRGYNIDLEAFVDADWVGDPELGRSTSGYINWELTSVLEDEETSYCNIVFGGNKILGANETYQGGGMVKETFE